MASSPIIQYVRRDDDDDVFQPPLQPSGPPARKSERRKKSPIKKPSEAHVSLVRCNEKQALPVAARVRIEVKKEAVPVAARVRGKAKKEAVPVAAHVPLAKKKEAVRVFGHLQGKVKKEVAPVAACVSLAKKNETVPIAAEVRPDEIPVILLSPLPEPTPSYNPPLDLDLPEPLDTASEGEAEDSPDEKNNSQISGTTPSSAVEPQSTSTPNEQDLEVEVDEELVEEVVEGVVEEVVEEMVEEVVEEVDQEKGEQVDKDEDEEGGKKGDKEVKNADRDEGSCDEQDSQDSADLDIVPKEEMLRRLFPNKAWLNSPPLPRAMKPDESPLPGTPEVAAEASQKQEENLEVIRRMYNQKIAELEFLEAEQRLVVRESAKKLRYEKLYCSAVYSFCLLPIAFCFLSNLS
jgi:hypothetical protein